MYMHGKRVWDSCCSVVILHPRAPLFLCPLTTICGLFNKRVTVHNIFSYAERSILTILLLLSKKFCSHVAAINLSSMHGSCLPCDQSLGF